MAKETCTWYLIILYWDNIDVEVIMSKSKQKIVDYASLFDNLDKFDEAKPINEKIIIRKIPNAGAINGPTRKSVIERFPKLIPERSRKGLSITKLG